MTGIPRFKEYEEQLRDQHGAPNRQIITVSGMAGTGTTTIANMLADHFGMERISAGDFFREKAAEYDMGIQEFDEKTAELEEHEDTDFDLEWDRTALEYAFTKNEFVLDGRLAGALLHGLAPVRVHVTCADEIVAERIADREDLSVDESLDHIRIRDREVLERYREKYGINPRDEKYYTVFVDNGQPLEQVREAVITEVQQQLPDWQD